LTALATDVAATARRGLAKQGFALENGAGRWLFDPTRPMVGAGSSQNRDFLRRSDQVQRRSV